MSDALSDVLSGLSASDVKIDALGRIKVTNPEMARKLRELADSELKDAPTNNSCNHGCSSGVAESGPEI
jgi:hypothetical protein